MIVSTLCVLLCAAALYGTIDAANLLGERRLVRLLIGGFILRIFIQLFIIRDVPFFSHAVGGDSFGYEGLARAIAAIWHRQGIHFVDAQEIEVIGPTSLPPNLFALVAYLDDGPTLRFGCTAIVALAAGMTALILYTLTRHFGASRERALLFTGILYLQPTFLFYTSDMYKDGLVVCFTLAALASALRLANGFTARDTVIGLVAIFALWYVRFYLIFVTTMPLVVGFVGLRAKGLLRSVIAALLLAVAVVVLAGSTEVLQLASERANETFQRGTSQAVLQSNSEGGSGVVFDDDGSPYSSLALKLAYTVFAPFLWARGSLGFQIGKLDVLIWYFVIYRAVRAAFQMDRKVVIMLATFIVPCSVMYAMGMSNVGLIVRQRLVVVVATLVLASLYVPKAEQAAARRRKPAAAPHRSRLVDHPASALGRAVARRASASRVR